MDIQIGKLVQNRTLDYLFPSIRMYGDTFIGKFNLVFKLAYGIHDTLLNGTPFESQRKLCILLDRKYRPSDYENFMRWLRLQEYYITDYSLDDTITGRQQMVLIEYPEQYAHVYDNFLSSQYSKMYTKDEIELMFKTEGHGKSVLNRSPEALLDFITRVNSTYGTNLTKKDFQGEDVEYDFPWVNNQEFFNN